MAFKKILLIIISTIGAFKKCVLIFNKNNKSNAWKLFYITTIQ